MMSPSLRASAVALLTLACGGGPPASPPPVPPEVSGSHCPLPLVVAPDEVRPRFVRIENPSDREIVVFLDRCFWHTRMADVPPGRWRQGRLPSELIAFDGALRFHAFDVEAGRYLGTYVEPVGREGILRLVLDPEERVHRETLPGDWALPKGAERFADEQTRLTDPEQGFTAVWGVGGGGVLTWACRDDDLFLSVALGRKVGGGRPGADEEERTPEPIPVELRFGRSGPWEALGAWSVVPSYTDAVVAPPERTEELTRRILGVDRLSVRTDEGRWRATTFAFDVTGVASDLAGLRCVDDDLATGAG